MWMMSVDVMSVGVSGASVSEVPSDATLPG